MPVAGGVHPCSACQCSIELLRESMPRWAKPLPDDAHRAQGLPTHERTKIVANVLSSSRRALGRFRWEGMGQRLDASVTGKGARLKPRLRAQSAK